ncbi:MAG TPA: MATE family efflux transporter [Thermoanaerobaculia bacterium]|nr:MATE family efflux transporter [Thermoanaerobaculia bacterium]
MSRIDRLRQELSAAVRLAAPVTLVQLGVMLMGVVDTMMLGHVSAEALAAGALGNIATFPLLIFGAGVLSALDPLIAQAHGADDREAISAHLQRGTVLALALSVPIGLLIAHVEPFLRWVGEPDVIVGNAAAFARGLIWGLPAFFLFFAFRQTLQAMSVVRPTAVAIVAGNLINVAGNWILIFGHLGVPALGVAGSAYATSFSRWAMFAWFLWVARTALGATWRGLTREALHLKRHLHLLRIGIPIGVHQSGEILFFATLALLVGRMGVVALAGHQIAINLASLSFMVPLGIGGAAATRVGNAIGRGDMPGARRAAAACLALGAGTMLAFAALFALLPEPLARLYTNDPGVIAMVALLLPIAAAFQVFDGIQTVGGGILRGAADTTFSAALAVVGFWVIGLPAGWYLAFRAGQGAAGLWWGMTVGLAAVSLFLVVRIVQRFRGTIGRA